MKLAAALRACLVLVALGAAATARSSVARLNHAPARRPEPLPAHVQHVRASLGGWWTVSTSVSRACSTNAAQRRRHRCPCPLPSCCPGGRYIYLLFSLPCPAELPV